MLQTSSIHIFYLKCIFKMVAVFSFNSLEILIANGNYSESAHENIFCEYTPKVINHIEEKI